MTDIRPPSLPVPASRVVQITHNDLDGYGASTFVGSTVTVDRFEHVTRYSDVEAVFRAELERLRGTEGTELLVVTDIAVEKGLAVGIRDFDLMNADRASPHALVVIDHHASSMEVLTDAGFYDMGMRAKFAASSPAGATAHMFVPPRPARHDAQSRAAISVLVDTSRSATGLCFDHPDLFLAWASPKPSPRGMEPGVFRALVEAVDAVDLWDRSREAFDAGEALNETFWECVQTYVPPGHELHDAFVSCILLDSAERIYQGDSAYVVEAAANRIRRDAVEWLVSQSGLTESPEQRSMTTRMRASRALAASHTLFSEPLPGQPVRLCFAMDPGIFQRVSDFMLDDMHLATVVNVQRGGAMSFRSRNGEALDMAVRFGGGGHSDAAGARIGSSGVFSLSEATRLFTEVLKTGVKADMPAWHT